MTQPPDPLRETVQRLEERVSRIEAQLQLSAAPPPDLSAATGPAGSPQEQGELEQQIGQYWFSKLGILTLALGVGFLQTIPHLPPLLPAVLGYTISAFIIALAQRWYAPLRSIAGYLLGCGIVLLYFTTLRLSFFSDEPALLNRNIETLLLGGAAAAGLLLSTRHRSLPLVGLSLGLCYATALFADLAVPFFIAVVLLSALAVVYAARFRWQALLTLAASFNVVSHLLWFLNSPFLGRDVALAASPHLNIYFVLLPMAVIGAGCLWNRGKQEEAPAAILTSIVNGCGGYLLFFFLTGTKFHEGFVLSHVLASALLLALAVFFWVRQGSLYSTFIYVMLGYAALSVAIVSGSKAPEYFVWLSWQSILVVTTAVWFSSRFIIVANFLIYLSLFIAYLVLAGTISAVSLNFGVVALLSARILNMRKDRLALKTELMRNAYLGSAFFIFPYALYHSLPPGLVSLSWLIIAFFYYLMARVLRNAKYRWMALLTLALTIVHVLAVDLTSVGPVFRVVSFLALGIVLLAVSVVYARKKKRVDDQPGSDTGHPG